MKIILIAAVERNGVIGRTSKPCLGCHEGRCWDLGHDGELHDACTGTGRVACNELPWPPGTYPEYGKHFHDVTVGHAVVMGRNTWESLPSKLRPLPGRDNIVVSSTPSLGHAGAWRMPTFPAAVEFASEFAKEHEKLFVNGGARLYAEALPLADELDLTLIDRDWGGDVRFPPLTLPTRDRMGMHHVAERRVIDFDCVERTLCPTNAELTFTRWLRR